MNYFFALIFCALGIWFSGLFLVRKRLNAAVILYWIPFSVFLSILILEGV